MEVDETFLLESYKGQRPIERPRPPPWQRQGQPAWPPAQQVPILVATDRSGSTMGYHLAAVNAANLKRVLVPVVRPMPYWSAPPTAVIRLWPEPSISPRERQCPSRREGPHLSISHSRIKDLQRRFPGVATKVLDEYLRWFHDVTLGHQPEPASTPYWLCHMPTLRELSLSRTAVITMSATNQWAQHEQCRPTTAEWFSLSLSYNGWTV